MNRLRVILRSSNNQSGAEDACWLLITLGKRGDLLPEKIRVRCFDRCNLWMHCTARHCHFFFNRHLQSARLVRIVSGLSMLTISRISKSFGGRTLFSDVSLQVNREDRIGLVGPNGAGKTTLFSIILQQEAPDDGNIHFERNTTFGYLPQESMPPGDQTVLELVVAITPEMESLQARLKAFEAGHVPEGDHAGEYDTLHARFSDLGGYLLEPRAKEILSGLSFRETDFHRPIREMSGGWVMRAHLARLLVQSPDLLILDEPTNHLDLESLQWFQNYLKNYPGAILMISHDREFLNNLVGSILEIRQSRVFRYRGNYDDYLAQREAQEAQQMAAYKNQQKEIARLQTFADRFRAKATKASQAQSKLKQIDRMEKIEAPALAEKTIHFHFPQPQRSGLRVVSLKDIHHAYGKNVVYQGMNFQAERGQRIVLVGPNGAGKSTLLKILAGVLQFQSGARELGHNVKAGYYSQYRVEMLTPERTVLEEAMDTPQHVTEQFIRTVLGSFLFRGDDVFKKVSVLSGGEKSRLALVKLLLDPPNLILMDEPTTHLDMASIDALLGALRQYSGTLIFISHDVYFIRALGNHVVHVNAGKLTHYSGGYQYYLDRTAAVSERAALTAGGRTEPVAAAPESAARSVFKTKEQKRIEAEQRQARSGRRKTQQQLVHQLEKKIAAAEQRVAELSAELAKPETYANSARTVEILAELRRLEPEVKKLNAEWESASSRLLELDSA
jgi:ATP-binding cassette, subfamily F, member 3